MTDVAPFVVPNTLVDLATTILATCGKALDDNSITGYSNRLISPGVDFPVDTPGSLVVYLTTEHTGQIGIQQFSGLRPGDPKWSDTVAVFKVELWALKNVPQPSATSVAGFSGPTANALTAYATDLLQAANVVYTALQYQQYANLLFPLKPCLIGPLTPIGPKGALVGMECPVQIQLP